MVDKKVGGGGFPPVYCCYMPVVYILLFSFDQREFRSVKNDFKMIGTEPITHGSTPFNNVSNTSSPDRKAGILFFSIHCLFPFQINFYMVTENWGGGGAKQKQYQHL